MEHASKDSSTKGSSATRAIYTDGSEPLPLIPGLRRFYEKADPLAWPIIRFAVSWPLIYRGYHKWSIGLDDAFAPFIAFGKIGRANVRITVTNAHLICRFLLNKKQ